MTLREVLRRAVVRWFDLTKRYNLDWRWTLESVIEFYNQDNYGAGHWPYIQTPRWLCKVSGHWPIDCNNHSQRKPEHDSCLWCDKPMPGEAPDPHGATWKL